MVEVVLVAKELVCACWDSRAPCVAEYFVLLHSTGMDAGIVPDVLREVKCYVDTC